jgi:hypothetical protein
MFAKLFIGGILAACCLLVMVVYSVDPGYRPEFIRSAVEIYVTIAFMAFVVIAVFASLLKWS